MPRIKTPETRHDEINARLTAPESADPLAGEVVPEGEDERSYLQRAVDAAKSAAKSVVGSSGTRPMLDSLGRIVEANPATFTAVERQQYLPLEKGRGGIRLLKQLWREAMEKRAQAQNVWRAAEERLTALKRLAAAENLSREFSLLGTPRPAEPERPAMVRVRATAPWSRNYSRVEAVSRELADWLYVVENVDDVRERYPDRTYSSAGRNHVTLVPEVIAAALVTEGLAERVGDDVPLQLPNGKRI